MRPTTPTPVRRVAVALIAAATALTALTAAPAAAVGDISDTANVVLPADEGPVQPDNSPAAVAIRFSQITFADDAADRVLLATTAAFADALASGTLQGTESPLLLTPPDDLRADVAGEIDRLGASEVTILGGTAAIDESVVEELEDAGLDVARIAGDTRLTTAAAVAAEVGDATTALLARGFGAEGDDTRAFADALAAGAWAAEEGWPVLLTQTDGLADATRDALAGSQVDRVIVLGGESAIGAEVVTDLESLGLDVDRVAGDTRFATAAAIAEARGFDSADDAQRIILAEGQAPDAWAAGFSAAAHAALVPAPVVLANGGELPPATVAFLIGSAEFAVDAADVDQPVLVCAAAAAACDRARLLLGLPQEATVTLDDAGEPVPSRSQLTGTVDLADQAASVTVLGECVAEGLLTPGEDGAIAVDVRGLPGACTIRIEITFANGSVQVETVDLTVAPAEPATGTIIDTETGGDAYTVVPEGADHPLVVDYTADDLFVVNGQAATIGAFEAAITVADRITFTADTEDGTVHDLTDVDPATISAGTVGDVDLGAATVAIVEPVSGAVLRGGLSLTDGLAYRVDGTTVDRAAFEAEVNEGDEIQVSSSSLRLTNRTVSGPATAITVDAISGIARFRAGGLGDDPLNAEDDRFRARAGTDAQVFRVDGRTVEFGAFAAALSEGDAVTYTRTAGVETFTLDNQPLPPVAGLVTETDDPDGSPVAPEPADGGSVVLLSDTGRRTISYTADAEFLLDGALATESEVEAALTPGDEVTYQAQDPGTDTDEQLALINRDLAGEVTDITEGANTYDVVTRAGVVHEDLDYAGAIFGGTDIYRINGDVVGLAQFENELALVDRGEVTGSIVVRRTTDGTEHRLATEDV